MVNNIKLLEFGIFHKSTKKSYREKDNSSPVGYYLRTDYLDLVEQTTRIDARIGTVFGIKYIIEPVEGKFSQEYVCRLSHPTLTNPKDGSTFDSIVEKKSDTTGKINSDFFEFEYDWEIEEGEWCFEIVSEETTLLKKKFTVTR